MNNSPDSEEWTDDRLLHEGVWLIERQLEIDPTEVKAWTEFVRKVWAARDAKQETQCRVSAIAKNFARKAHE